MIIIIYLSICESTMKPSLVSMSHELKICFTKLDKVSVGDAIPKYVGDVQVGHLPTPV